MTTGEPRPRFPDDGALMRIDLIKYQALGNDYLVLDLPGPLDEVVALLPALCDRHRGLGSDGLLAFDPQAMTVRIFNPDRSEAQKSGNGLRIAAAHAVLEHGAGERFELRTAGGANPVRVLSRHDPEIVCEVDIGRPSFRAADLPATFEGEPDRVQLRTEAGSVAAACMRAGLVDEQVTIQMPGGDLSIRREKGGNLVQSGPARRVYRATVDLADFRPEP